MPVERREEIAAICRRYSVAIVEDDIFGFLPDRPPPRLSSLAPENSVLVTSLSKPLAPGLRIGYLATAMPIMDRVESALRAQAIMVTPLMAELASQLIRSGEARRMARIGRSACDQCRYCTEFCPHFLLGYAVEPHQVMRGLGFSTAGSKQWNEWASLCCSCGLCTLYACPEDLYPKEACDDAKVELRATGFKWSGPAPTKPHPFHDGRHVPIERLVGKLGIGAWDKPAPLRPFGVDPSRLMLALKQSAGVACTPLVRAGQEVRPGDLLAEPPEGALGARLHREKRNGRWGKRQFRSD